MSLFVCISHFIFVHYLTYKPYSNKLVTQTYYDRMFRSLVNDGFTQGPVIVTGPEPILSSLQADRSNQLATRTQLI